MSVDVMNIVKDNIDVTVHLSLATAKDNKPWVCEVHFAYDKNFNLYFRSLSSRRHSQEIAENPHVAGNIIDLHPVDRSYVLGIYFEGKANMIEDKKEKTIAAQLLAERLHSNLNEIIDESRDPNGHQFYKITVREWSVFGKFKGQDQPSSKHIFKREL